MGIILEEVGKNIWKSNGIVESIVNKRISVTPISLVGGNIDTAGFVSIAKTLDKAAKEVGVNFIGGYSALVQKGSTKGDINLVRSIPEALTVTASINRAEWI